MAEYKVGDVVRLKSGGPAMTVLRDAEPLLYVAWFDGAQDRTGFYPPDALVDARADTAAYSAPISPQKSADEPAGVVREW